MSKREPLRLDLLKDLIPRGLDFGSNYLVEFEPASLWYETSLTLAADALSNGVRTDYHTFTHLPGEVRRGIEGRGIDLPPLEENDTFRIWDSYSLQTGVQKAEKIGKLSPIEKADLRSLKLEDWWGQVRSELLGRVDEIDTYRLHIDDDTSLLLRYNPEKTFIDHWRQMAVPYSRKLSLVMIHSAVAGVYSEKFYRQLESFIDGIIDFKAIEHGNHLKQLMRVRMMRGKKSESEWKQINSFDDGKVIFTTPQSQREIKNNVDRELEIGSNPDFEFESSRSEVIFTQLSSDFLHDYMVSNYMQDKAGWRTIVQVAQNTGIPVSSLYKRGKSPTPFNELIKRGVIEMRVSPGERGRGGKITRVRVAYEKEPVRDYVNRIARSLEKMHSQ